MWRRLVLFLVACLLSACSDGGNVWRALDAWVFGNYGSTLFERPEEVPLIRGVHLGLDNLGQSSVIIQGLVEEASPNGTYVVISDQSGRLLVVLSQLALEQQSAMGLKSKTLRVLGTVESGKKGLPYLRARAMWSVVQAEAKVDQKA
jgi:hypothetical protein